MQPDRISAQVARQLTNPQNELWLSPVSVWEVRVLYDKKRVKLIPDADTWIADNLSELNIREAPLTFEVARALPSIPLTHGDPADRFIAASAKVFGLTLVTADRRLLEMPGIQVLANR